jgi:PAS domain S-box-containing protein
MHDRGGAVIGVQGLFWDVTPQKLQQAVTRVLADSATLREATVEIVRAICESMGWDFGSLWIADREAQVFRCVESWPTSDDGLKKLAFDLESVEQPEETFDTQTVVPPEERLAGLLSRYLMSQGPEPLELLLQKWVAVHRQPVFRPGEGIVGRVWADGELIWIPDVLDWVPEVISAARFPFPGLRGAVGFPILRRGEILGVLEFYSRDMLRLRDPDPGGDLLPVMTALGSQIGQYIERKQAEEDRDRNLELIQAIIDNSPDAIYVKDPKGRYLFANRWYEAALHCDRRTVKGKTDYDLFPAPVAAIFQENDRRVLQDREPLEFVELVPQDDGDHVYSSKKYPLLDATGLPYAVCGISTDITEQRLAEAAKLHDLSHLIEELPAVFRRTALLGEELSPEQSGRLNDALEKVNVLIVQARAVTRTTLAYTLRHPSGIPSPPPVTACSAEVRRWLREVPRIQSDAAIRVQLRDQLAPEEPFLADLNGVLYALRNLWTNAWNAFGALSRATYRVILNVGIEPAEGEKLDEGDGAYVVLRVADNGAGIRAEVRDRIFRGRVASAGGHGLGSQIIRWVMDSHRGLIRYATAEKVGTLVELWFPRLSPPRAGLNFADQWERYRALRDEAGAARQIGEDALLSVLGG